MNENVSFTLQQIEFIKKTISEALETSRTCNNILFKNSIDKTNELIASTYLNKAISLISSVKSVYYSNIAELENSQVEGILFQFNIYSSEFLKNLSTDHSHQWTSIEFERLEELVNSFIQ